MKLGFRIFGLKDPHLNLKIDPNFIRDYQKNEIHIEFRKCIEKRFGTGIKKLLWKESFGETSKEWQMAYDPVNTLKRCKRYGRALPDHFLKRQQEMDEWGKLLERRADVVTIRADQGQVINEIVDGIMSGYIVETLEKREQKKVRINQEHLEYVLDELQNAPYLKMADIPFKPLP